MNSLLPPDKSRSGIVTFSAVILVVATACGDDTRPDARVGPAADAGSPSPDAAPDAGPTLFAAGTFVVQFGLDEEALYYARDGSMTKELARMALTGGAPPTVLATGDDLGYSHIGLTKRFVFWSRTDMPRVRFVAKDGSATPQEVPALAGGGYYYPITCGESRDAIIVLFHDAAGGERLYQADLAISNGMLRLLADPFFSFLDSDVLCDGLYVYWPQRTESGSYAIYKMALGTGTPSVVLDNIVQPSALAQDTTYLYWTSVDIGVMRRVSKDGFDQKTIFDNLTEPRRLRVSRDYVAWGSFGELSGVRLGRKNGSASVLVPRASWYMGDVELGAEHVYWIGDRGIWRTRYDTLLP